MRSATFYKRNARYSGLDTEAQITPGLSFQLDEKRALHH
jgi:hypothetical protein